MKNLTIIPILLFVLLLISQGLYANDKYTETMQKNIDGVYQAKTVEELQGYVNTFHRIGEAEKTKWEPFYYEAFGYVMISTREADGSKKDANLDLALKAIEKAKAIQPNESELVAMEGFVHMIRLTVDPATRGQQYSGLAMQTFGKALGMNPNNPRAMSLMAQMQLGTARFFNQLPTEACETARKAATIFESATESENSLAPRWGKEMNLEVVKSCK